MTRRERRHRGAQPGNQNARKHGFYSNVFTPSMEKDLIAARAIEDLDQEIALTRTKIMSILRHQPDNISLLLRAISTVERLVRSRSRLPRYVPEELPTTETVDRFLNRLTGGLS
jgi:hypothetical protein